MSPPARVVLTVLTFYRDAVSPALPPRCRFYPSCSTYAVTAVSRYGAARGGWLALRRIVRCGPWNLGGVDHVPSKHGDPSPDKQPSVLAATPKSVGPQRRPLSQERAVV